MSASQRPPTLLELQNWLRRIVTDPRGVAEALRSEPVSSCLGVIVGDARYSREERLSVYAEAYFARVLQSLSEDFRSLRRLMGDEDFAGLIAAYLERHPSRCDGLEAVGFALPDFLEASTGEHARLAALARLEWKVMESLHADTAPPRGTCPVSEAACDALASKPLVLNPSLRLLATRWDVDLFWNNQVEELHERARFLEIMRIDGRVEVSSLSEREFSALELAASGRNLAEICELLIETVLPDEIQSWSSRWVARRILCGVRME